MDNNLVRTDTCAQLKRLCAALGVAAAVIGGPLFMNQAPQAETMSMLPAAEQVETSRASSSVARNRITMVWDTEMAHAAAQGGVRSAGIEVPSRVSVSLTPAQFVRGDLVAQLR